MSSRHLGSSSDQEMERDDWGPAMILVERSVGRLQQASDWMSWFILRPQLRSMAKAARVHLELMQGKISRTTSVNIQSCTSLTSIQRITTLGYFLVR